MLAPLQHHPHLRAPSPPLHSPTTPQHPSGAPMQHHSHPQPFMPKQQPQHMQPAQLQQGPMPHHLQQHVPAAPPSGQPQAGPVSQPMPPPQPQPTPPAPQQQHHLAQQQPAASGASAQHKITPQHFASLNESAWLGIGSIHEIHSDPDGAMHAYEQALRHNSYSIPALNAISCILRTKENFPRAVEYLQVILKIDGSNGEVWGSLGHCYLMMEDLQQAYAAYQQALYHLRDPKEPKLWYGIGILYDRYGSLEHAEEAFSQVMHMQPDFEKANEIYFRLGIIYKQQQKYSQSLECFKWIVKNPPRPLTEEDIWFQIGHVHEQQKDFDAAKAAYRRVLDRDPNHAKVLQQLGWLHHQESSHYASQEQAIEYLEKSVNSDNQDAQSWYLLGRCYMSQQKYSKAYEAYQQAVYRDGRNPTFWCSIGVLYYQINQYRDALDAYSRAIRLNPYISEVWYDLGTLYESCNNQTNDALDAYQRAFDLDPTNTRIKDRLQLLRVGGQSAALAGQGSAPVPQDVHPQQYQAPGIGAPPGHQWGPPSGPNQLLHTSSITQPSSTSHSASISAMSAGPPHTEWHRRHSEAPRPSLTQGNTIPAVDRPEIHQGPPLARLASPRHEQQQRQIQQIKADHHAASSPPLSNARYAQGAEYNLPHFSQEMSSRLAPVNYPLSEPGVRFPPNSGAGPPSTHFGRNGSPPLEIKPLIDGRPPSVGAGGVHHDSQNGIHSAGIAVGAPPPKAALAAAEAAARTGDDKPGPLGIKRALETDDEGKEAKKVPANGTSKTKLEDAKHRRQSPPNVKPSPRARMRSPGSRSRRGGTPVFRRRASSNTLSSTTDDMARSSKAEGHSQTQSHQSPKIASIKVPSDPEALETAPKESAASTESQDTYEAAARKVSVDEDYDNEPEDDPKNKIAPSGPQSPSVARSEPTDSAEVAASS